MTLYEINEQIRNAIEYGCDPETGEIIDVDALEELEMARDEKIENICLYIKDLKAEAAAIKAEKDALDARMKASSRKAESLTNYLQQELAGERFKTSKVAISYRKTFELEKALEITEAIAEETGTVEDRRELSVLYNTMGSQLRTEERRSRQQCFEKAYEIRKAIADETGTFGAYRDLARVFEK